MPSTSKALLIFANTSQRSIALAKLYATLASAPEPPPNVEDVLRSAVALAVAAMDAYFTRRFVELLIPYLKQHGPNKRLVELLSSAGLGTEEALRLAAMDRPFRRIRALVAEHLAAYTTQRFHRIDDLFLCFGLKDLSVHAQASIHKKRLLRQVELLVIRRNAIVHDGDLDKNGRLCPINSRQIVQHMDAVVDFVVACDKLISRAIKV